MHKRSATAAGMLFFLAVVFCLWPSLTGMEQQWQLMFIYLFVGWGLLIAGLFFLSRLIKKENNSLTRRQ
ncbi:MAG: hypothetical protein NC924_07065 [Candidatus Omnitrophica bacterium]|nr:hypothetical protein [Candidatus Omnitrophota bacterium]